jgi:DNA-3-methyladenine glycosylase
MRLKGFSAPMPKTCNPQPEPLTTGSLAGLENARLLSREFFLRDPRRVACDLLGKLLVRRDGDKGPIAGRIVETEVYLGQGDPAAHAAAGRTARNCVLFGPPGYAYVYFIYGNHYCLNVSCMPAGEAGSVLFRALEPVLGAGRMARNRGLDVPPAGKAARLLTSGPGRLCQAFAITRQRDNGKDLVAPGSGLSIMDDGFRVPAIAATPRIGITKAADRPLRYVIAGNRFVSGKR